MTILEAGWIVLKSDSVGFLSCLQSNKNDLTPPNSIGMPLSFF